MDPGPWGRPWGRLADPMAIDGDGLVAPAVVGGRPLRLGPMSRSTGPREIAVPTGEGSLAARAWGPVDGPPVLALHGWLDNAASFDGLAPRLADACVVALDLPGHGRSPHRAGGLWYHLVDYVADAVAAADSLGWSRLTLLGHSLGGAVATLVAATQPERLEALYLIEALGPLSQTPEEAPQRLRRALERAQRSHHREPATYATLEEAVEARRSVGGLSAAAARRLAERGTVAVEGGLRWRSDRRLRWPSPAYFSEEQVQAFLAAIEAPTTVVRAHDGLIDMQHPAVHERLAALGHPRLCEVPGNHHVHLEDPDRVAQALGLGAG